MSASHLPQLEGVALQLLTALAEYERDVDAMVRTWLDMDRYHDVSREIDEVRLYSLSLPSVSVQWGALLVAHSDLVHTLWRRGAGRDSDGDLEMKRMQHTDCIDSLRRRCMSYLQRGDKPVLRSHDSA